MKELCLLLSYILVFLVSGLIIIWAAGKLFDFICSVFTSAFYGDDDH